MRQSARRDRRGRYLIARPWGGRAEKALQESVDGDRPVALAAPDHGALEAEFEILRGPEADLLHVHPGVAGIDHVGRACHSGCQRRHIGVPSAASPTINS